MHVYMYVCMYVCIYVCVCMCVCMYLCMHVYVHVCMNMCFCLPVFHSFIHSFWQILYISFCPTLAKGSRWQIIQMWVIYILRLNFTCYISWPSLLAEGLILLREVKMTWYHFDFNVNDGHIPLKKYYFCNSFPVCQSRAVFYLLPAGCSYNLPHPQFHLRWD